MNVAIAQMRVAPLDIEANVIAAVNAISSAAGADLLVLPELMSIGYTLDREAIMRLAEPADGSGPALSAWRAAAQKCDVAVVGGFAERYGDHLYNAAAVIDRRGVVVNHYRKLHLFAGERDVFTPGDLGLPVINIADAAVGVLICYDLRFPEALRVLALQGADLVAVPTAWVDGFDRRSATRHSAQIDGVLVQANLNQVFVACADQIGSSGTFVFHGGSLVASPYGEALVGPLDVDREGTVCVRLDLEEARHARERGEGISPRQDRRLDVFGEMLGYDPATRSAHAPAPRRRSARATIMLDEVRRTRGYVLQIHELLAEWDPAFLRSYDSFLDAAFMSNTVLDRRTRELVYIGVLTALGAPQDHLIAHLRAALAHGATERELLAVLEQVLPPVGVPRFIEAMRAYREVCGDAPLEGGRPGDAGS